MIHYPQVKSLAERGYRGQGPLTGVWGCPPVLYPLRGGGGLRRRLAVARVSRKRLRSKSGVVSQVVYFR